MAGLLDWYLNSDVASVLRTVATLALLVLYLRARRVIRNQRIKIRMAHLSIANLRGRGAVYDGVRHRLVPVDAIGNPIFPARESEPSDG